MLGNMFTPKVGTSPALKAEAELVQKNWDKWNAEHRTAAIAHTEQADAHSKAIGGEASNVPLHQAARNAHVAAAKAHLHALSHNSVQNSNIATDKSNVAGFKSEEVRRATKDISVTHSMAAAAQHNLAKEHFDKADAALGI